jgi:hypothetical protein
MLGFFYFQAKPFAVFHTSCSKFINKIVLFQRSSLSRFVRLSQDKTVIKEKSLSLPQQTNNTMPVKAKHKQSEAIANFNYWLKDAGGERTLKLWDGYQYMLINGQQQIGFFDITDYTLYTSPYMVLTPEQYTKHYYAESDRIVSKIGGGMEIHIYNNLVFSSIIM